MFELIDYESDHTQFINYLNRPIWFKVKFNQIFDQHRKKNQGTILLVKKKDAVNSVIGCVYYELNPHHLSYGKKVPIFGWLQADNEKICHILLKKLESIVKKRGYSTIRGPINLPSLYGGWGTKIWDKDKYPLINSSENSKKLSSWIKTTGFKLETEYISLKVTEWDPGLCPFEGIEIITFPIFELLENKKILKQIKDLLKTNFSSFLPDTSTEDKIHQVISLLSSIERGEDFLLLAFDIKNGKLAGLILEIPNIFDLWQGKEIESADIDTIIIAKEYRNASFMPWLYSIIHKKLQLRGIKRHIGATIWSKNKPALTGFSKGSIPIANFNVFQMNVV